MKESILVSFPNMNLEFNISSEAFRIFNKSIYWYGIIIALAMCVCVIWAIKDSKKFDLVPDTVIDLMLFAAPISIIFARLYYVIFRWEDYSSNLLEIFNIRNGGLAIYGGIIGAVITAYFVARYKKIPTFKFFDFAIPYVPLGQAIGRWGNFFNQEAFGTNTSLPWGMKSSVTKAYLQNNMDAIQQLHGITVNPDLPVHPTFLYESILDLAIFVFLMWMRRKKKFDGEVFCFYFITYSLGRAFIEGLRTDSLMLGNMRVSQFLSVVLVIAFGIYIVYKRIKLNNESLELEYTGKSVYAGILKEIEEEEKLEAEKKTSSLFGNEHNEVDNDLEKNIVSDDNEVIDQPIENQKNENDE
ncbi:prolipoprotein diacylglyceryl transferase [Ruminiclostridium herbifermentans]|uniref:Phosphatidylglycerol--prolipoprotein diacylglyceryl transferase n=1 Tax=Ruminiclostridium herbifermentans TaxID=2488810 RepID=A0A4U7JI71_9FIRM|nr:prolipoprotein diacylglyceryl transferase [Ruminiclostridium herbifermentans]QNU65723.1 prolipoprotein diacylglyceryl transferase [Ruminiclostridium herbifermentans]